MRKLVIFAAVIIAAAAAFVFLAAPDFQCTRATVLALLGFSVPQCTCCALPPPDPQKPH